MLICCASAPVETLSRSVSDAHQSRCCNFLFKGNFKGGVGGGRQRRLRFLLVGSKGMLELGMTQRFLRGSFPLQGTPPPPPNASASKLGEVSCGASPPVLLARSITHPCGVMKKRRIIRLSGRSVRQVPAPSRTDGNVSAATQDGFSSQRLNRSGLAGSSSADPADPAGRRISYSGCRSNNLRVPPTVGSGIGNNKSTRL